MGPRFGADSRSMAGWERAGLAGGKAKKLMLPTKSHGIHFRMGHLRTWYAQGARSLSSSRLADPRTMVGQMGLDTMHG